MPDTENRSAVLVNGRTDYEIQEKYVLLYAAGGSATFSKHRNDALREAEALVALLKKADAMEAAGENPSGLRTSSYVFGTPMRDWKKRMRGKTIAEKYPNATLVQSLPFVEIDRDISYVTVPSVGGVRTSAMELGLYNRYLETGALVVQEYTMRPAAEIFDFPGTH